MSFKRILYVMRKELAAILRDPRARAILMVVPAFQLFLFSYAVVIDVTHVPVCVLDLNQSPQSREVIRRLQGSGYFNVERNVDSMGQLSDEIDHERASLGVVISGRFARTLESGGGSAVSFIVDGTQSNTAQVIMNYVVNIMGQYAHDLLRQRLEASSEAVARVFPQGSLPRQEAGDWVDLPGKVQVEHRIWYNPGLTSRYYYIPGVIGLTIIIVGMIVMALSVVREKEEGTLEQLIVTPLRPMELILGKVVPITGLLLVSVSFQLILAFAWFHMPLNGSILVLYFTIFLFLLNTLGVGIFISTISSTQQQAMLTSFFYNMPAVLLSGFLFPISSMPKPIQYLTYLNPFRYFIECTRGILLRGVGLEVLAGHLAALALLGTATLVFSALRFHKRLS